MAAAIAYSASLMRAQAAGSQPPEPQLSDYQGRYDYLDDGTLFIVASGERLFAIIGDSKYPLQPAGTETFKNAVGDTIPFYATRVDT